MGQGGVGVVRRRFFCLGPPPPRGSSPLAADSSSFPSSVRGRFTGVVSLSAPLEAAEAGERGGRESDEGPGAPHAADVCAVLVSSRVPAEPAGTARGRQAGVPHDGSRSTAALGRRGRGLVVVVLLLVLLVVLVVGL
ncbi:hypothetical protein CRUP_024452 [Coryphaenoides rupestris]|nr:hypothetical protein CRUP_024452 [Coryphaenoides rupestris]